MGPSKGRITCQACANHALRNRVMVMFVVFYWHVWASQVVLVVKNLPPNAGDIRDEGSIPGLGRSPGEGHGNPLQYSSFENPTDREDWWATVQGVHRVGCDLARMHAVVL